MFTVTKTYHGITTPMESKKTMPEAVKMIEEDRATCNDGELFYHIKSDDGRGIEEEMDFSTD